MCGGFAVPSATAGSGPDLAAVAAHYRGQKPTQWATSLPGVATTFAASGRQIALTFDACRGACDDALLATLERNAVPALLFLSSKWIDANPGRAEKLAANPLFEIGNHGTRHVPLSVTGRSAYGIRGVVDELGERPLGFRVDADNGAKASPARVRSAITGAAPGSVVLAHLNHPESGTAAGVSDAIIAAGWEFVSLTGQIVQ